MSLAQILKEKKKHSSFIKQEYNLPQKNNLNWLILINDEKLLIEFIESLSVLNANFIITSELKQETPENVVITKEINNKNTIWFDFIICDDKIDGLSEYLREWVVPIISENSHMSSILKEFNPVKNTWNSFLYKEDNKWSIFYSLIRYLENSKFPFDNKNLIKNVLEI